MVKHQNATPGEFAHRNVVREGEAPQGAEGGPSARFTATAQRLTLRSSSNLAGWGPVTPHVANKCFT